MPGYLIRRLNQISVSLFAERTAAAGLDLTNVQYAALYALDAHPGIDQATLSGLIAYDRVTIGGVIDRLVAKGYVRREVSRRDRRARELQVSPAGRCVLQAMRPVVAAVQAELVCALETGEVDTLMALLRKMTQAGNEFSRAPQRP